MAEAKLDIKVGSLSFAGEGSEAWLSQQFDKWLEALPSLHERRADGNNGGDEADALDDTGASGDERESTVKAGALAAYLKDTKSTTSQARKFLATAAWLESAGKERITTGDVTKALSQHKQGRLTNASQCLANNVAAGKIVKDGKRQFYVSDEGFKELKH